MKLSTAVALRISNILRERKMSQYRLEKIIAMPHNTMKTLMGERNSGVNLKTVIAIADGFNITISDFLNSDLFQYNNLNMD